VIAFELPLIEANLLLGAKVAAFVGVTYGAWKIADWLVPAAVRTRGVGARRAAVGALATEAKRGAPEAYLWEALLQIARDEYLRRGADFRVKGYYARVIERAREQGISPVPGAKAFQRKVRDMEKRGQDPLGKSA